MQSVGQKNTGPELQVRRALHGMGYRYRLHAKELPGRPDIALRPRRAVIFVHGCFWHGHGCAKGRLPTSKLDYWESKLDRNKLRDAENVAKLEAAGWRVLTLWSCETGDSDRLSGKLRSFLATDAIRSTRVSPSASFAGGKQGAA